MSGRLALRRSWYWWWPLLEPYLLYSIETHEDFIEGWLQSENGKISRLGA